MTFADCGVCGQPIQDPERATLLRDSTTDSDTDAGSVDYRHVDCDPADTPRDYSTVVDM